jgi:dTDP-4-amino-4,6-dideoxygalactose transaminase
MTAVERKVPLLDLRALHAPVRDAILAEITRVVDSQAFIMGEDVKALEKSVAAYCGAAHAAGCASGSDALLLALLAVGVKPGDAVATTPFTFFATAGAIVRAGATPVFVDIQPDTFNIDPNKLESALKANNKIKTMIPVHLFGACADMDPIMALARQYNCAVIEDAAQSIGAEYKGQRAVFGDVSCISFFPSKNLGAFGDGGMVLSNDETLAKKLAALRVHGAARKYYHDYVGINSRLDTLQAAILRLKFQFLDNETAGRNKHADLYRGLLKDAPIGLPYPAEYQTRHVYNQFVIRAPRRDELKTDLQQNGIGSEIYYPLSLHQQVCFKNLGYSEGDFPESEKAAREVLALPVHSALSPEDIEYVCRKISEFYNN